MTLQVGRPFESFRTNDTFGWTTFDVHTFFDPVTLYEMALQARLPFESYRTNTAFERMFPRMDSLMSFHVSLSTEYFEADVTLDGLV